MSDITLQMEHVYKKFRKGEMYNSLRDLIPALTGKMFRQQDLSANDAREFWALEDITFEARRGEAFGIVGANGAGKSTALKILSRIMRPTKGRMVVNGRLSALIEVGAGFHQDLTGRENIFLNGTILGMTKRDIAAKLDRIIDFSGIEAFIDTPVKHYSSGMYARLGFAVAAHVDPEVMLVDEVLSVGDYVFQNKCIQRMKEVIANGSTVLFVSHNMKAVAEICQRCLLLEKGQSRMIGPSDKVIAAYLNRARESELNGASSKEVVISSVKVRNQFGECTRFHSGEKTWIDVEVRGRAHSTKLALCVYLLNEEHQEIFNTSTERLGLGNFTLEEGDVYNCTFELHLNLPSGIFHPSVLVYRYDTQTTYDKWAPAATIHISSDQDVRGFTHCFPRVLRQEICPASELAGVQKLGDTGSDRSRLPE